MESKKILFRNLPKVDDILQRERVCEALKYIPREIILETVREVLEDIRESIMSSNITKQSVENKIEKIDNFIIEKSKIKIQPKLRKVINGTGTIIHTNLGRSLISKNIMEKVITIASSYSNLEYNLEQGNRGSRYSHIEDIICRITGAEAALVVNNNASAIMLILSTLAKEKEVIVSRGELVEIGGSFRVPEVMEQSGGKLVAIGTTNKTHLSDYESAIGEETAVLLKVHTSNYRIVGFTDSVPIEELVNLGKIKNVPVIEDIGSGVLIDLSKYGLSYEPTVQDSLKAGADIVSFSGDKLLGGPQAGIIVGKKQLIDEMKKNQLTRAIRVDKMTIATLELVLREYLDEKKAIESIPTLRMLTMSLEDINKKAEKLYNLIIKNIDDIQIEILDDYSQVGGGSLPLERIPTKVLSIKGLDLSINSLQENLRKFRVPIITRINNNNLLIDVRTTDVKDFDIIIEGIKWSINNYRSE